MYKLHSGREEESGQQLLCERAGDMWSQVKTKSQALYRGRGGIKPITSRQRTLHREAVTACVYEEAFCGRSARTNTEKLPFRHRLTFTATNYSLTKKIIYIYVYI